MKRRYCILVLPCPVRFGGISSVCMLAAMTVFGSAAYFFMCIAGSCSPNIELGLVSQTNTLFANSVSAGHRCTIDSRVEVLYYIWLYVPW